MKNLFFKSRILVMLSLILPMMTLTVVTSCSKDSVITPNSGNENQQDQVIVVTVDANGNASDGHRFVKIDETNFYIDDIKYTAQNGDLIVTGYNVAFFKGTANIISVLKYQGRTMNVVRIANEAFKDCSVLTSVIISEGLIGIGNNAFFGCINLTAISIPNSVTSIGLCAFEYCNALVSIKVETDNKKYDSRNNCNAIIETSTNTLIAGCQSTTIPNSVTVIAQQAFWNCASLTSITIPNSVTDIGTSAFYGCCCLTSVNIPSNVTYIGDYTFYGCSRLTSINIPNSVTFLGDYAFYGCSGLTSVTIPNSITSIGRKTFSGCTSLVSITFPNGVISIGEDAFFYCSSLTSITIPNSVSNIERYAFYGCRGLKSIILGSSVTTIDRYVFQACLSLKDFYCYAENVPVTSSDTFEGSSYLYATLHVPAGSIEAYKAKSPWKNFGTIVALTEDEINGMK